MPTRPDHFVDLFAAIVCIAVGMGFVVFVLENLEKFKW